MAGNWPRSLDRLLGPLDRVAGAVRLRLTRRDFEIRHLAARQREIVARVTLYTATDGPAIVGLLDAVGYLQRNDVPGAIVECGVYRGGSVMAAASGLLRDGPRREIWLYDTFEGMTEPDDVDVRLRDGRAAADIHERERSLPAQQQSDWYWVRAELESVKANLSMTGYPEDLLRYVVGRVEDTIPEQSPESIALLRLDTDWYA